MTIKMICYNMPQKSCFSHEGSEISRAVRFPLTPGMTLTGPFSVITPSWNKHLRTFRTLLSLSVRVVSQ